MNPADFWLLMSHVRRQAGGCDPEEIGAGLSRAVAAHATARGATARALRREMEKLDTVALRDVAGQLWILDERAWLELRAWCICQGRAFCRRLVRDPAALRALAFEVANPFDPPRGAAVLRAVLPDVVVREEACAR